MWLVAGSISVFCLNPRTVTVSTAPMAVTLSAALKTNTDLTILKTITALTVQKTTTSSTPLESITVTTALKTCTVLTSPKTVATVPAAWRARSYRSAWRKHAEYVVGETKVVSGKVSADKYLGGLVIASPDVVVPLSDLNKVSIVIGWAQFRPKHGDFSGVLL